MIGTAPLVLVVDDVAATRQLMRRILERDHMRVLEAASGEEAIRTIAGSRPEAVVLDLRLPGMSGFDVARTVRANPDEAIAATPLLACSASIQQEVRREALAAGCDDFQGKPFDIVTFAQRVRDLIGHEAVE
jgi:CheY-like chemotaxis protein